MSHQVQRDWKSRLKRWIPFGLGQVKPKHYRDMVKVVLDNRDNLGYAWKVLSKGVCDGCALGVSGFHDWTIQGTHLCMTRLNLLRLNTMPEMDLGRLADVQELRGMDNRALRGLGRLGAPMLRRAGDRGFQRITWDQAIGRIADRLRATEGKRIAFYLTSRGLTNEVYYVAQKAARFLGTNSIENAARLCHSPSTAAMKQAIGVAASTCSYKDWIGTDLIVLFGANPANDQPVAIKYLHEAKKKGTRIAVVNPYREPGLNRYWVPSTASSALFGTDLMDWWFPVAGGGDIAFLWGVIKVLLAQGWYDRAFVEGHTTGFDDLQHKANSMAWPDLEKSSGLAQASMEEFARILHEAPTGVFIWSMGITQHSFGTDAVGMIVNVGLLRGYVGRDRCGLVPIRGHSGVQGGAEMGAYATVFPGGKPINKDTAAQLSKTYGFQIPDTPGLPTPQMVVAAERGELDILWSLGGNFLRNLPDTRRVGEAMAKVPLRIHQDIIVTDQMLIDPCQEVILLPAQTRYEQEGGGTETTTERRVLFSPQIPRQVGEARCEWRILRDVAAAVDPKRFEGFGCESGQAIREEIARVIPLYNGIQNFKATGDQFQYGGAHLCAGGQCATPDGKGKFRMVDLPDLTLAPGQFMVSTRRGKQFNSLIYGDNDPITGANRDAIMMNPDDAAEQDLADGDRAALVNDIGRLPGTVVLSPLARGQVQVHWPEGNVIIGRDSGCDPGGGVPDYNTKARIEK